MNKKKVLFILSVILFISIVATIIITSIDFKAIIEGKAKEEIKQEVEEFKKEVKEKLDSKKEQVKIEVEKVENKIEDVKEKVENIKKLKLNDIIK